MEDRETPRMHKYGERKTTQIMMATVPYVTAWARRMKYHTDGFLLDWVYRVIRNETCVQVYQKCDKGHVYRVIRNETCVQDYLKCDMGHVYRVISSETCVQGYQKWDMRHVGRVIRNVTWEMWTGLSEMWHETWAGLSEMWHETCV